MKKSRMCSLTVGMLAVAMLFSTLAEPTWAAGTIILVGPAAPGADVNVPADFIDNPTPFDAPLVTFLEGLGHTVSYRSNMEDANQGPGRGLGPDVPALNTAELVVVSRAAFSGDYDQNAQLWNEVSSPLLLMNGFLVRGSRWAWENGSAITDVDQAVQDIVITDPAHPYVQGLGGTQVFDYSDPSYDPKRIGNGGTLDKLNPVASLTLPGTEIAATIAATNAAPLAFAFSIPAGADTGKGVLGGKRGFVGTDTYISDPKEDYGLRLTADYDLLLTNAVNTLLVPEPGFLADFDNDNDVDGADFLAFQRGFGTLYDDTDMTNWKSEFGSVAAAAAVSAVPEPASLLLASMMVATLAVCRRRRPKVA